MAIQLFLVPAVVVLLQSGCFSKPVDSNISPDSLNYLEKYGYFVPPDPKAGQLLSERNIVIAIKKLQRFAGLKETGTFDAETKKLVQTPRCGVADIAESSAAKRKKRYALQGTHWKKSHLTWRLFNTGNDGMTRDQSRAVIRKAFSLWAEQIPMTFEEKNIPEPDIKMEFVRGYHKDSYPFDGRGGTLAHAFYPHENTGIAGDVHYDDDEEFTIGTPKGKNFLWVTVHELGHSLGLEHSRVQGAIMYPWYQGYKGENFKLEYDDIVGIATIYGSRPDDPEPPKTTLPPVTRSLTTAQPPPRVCTDRIQSVFLGRDKKTYIINKDKVYILGSKFTVLEKGPVPVSKLFQGVDYVDATFRRQSDRRLIFFSGDKYHQFDGYRPYRGPKKISDGFSGLPVGFSGVDAAFVWPRNNRLYIFKGSQYYRFTNRGENYVLDYGYPVKISEAWGGIPDNVDAVFSWHNKKTYFFKGSKYYRLDDRKIKAVSGYPRHIRDVWMNCLSALSDPGNSSSTQRPMPLMLFAVAFMSALYYAY